MSKSFALAGLRIGWIATRDRELLARLAAFKDYTTICNSAPSEVLALIALRARDRVLARNRAIVEANLPLWTHSSSAGPGPSVGRPRGGNIGFRASPPGACRSTIHRRTVGRRALILPGTVSPTPAITSASASAGRTCPRPWTLDAHDSDAAVAGPRALRDRCRRG
jgi:hypothetical protein